MSTVQRSIPSGGSGVSPVDPDPYRFRTGRVVLIVEGVALAVLGGWGLLATATTASNATTAGPGPAGAPVLLHLTVADSALLLATGLLALLAARRRSTALILTGAQFVGYLLLFTAGSVAYARAVSTPLGLDVADLAGYLVLTALGAALFMWFSGQGLEGRWWARAGAGATARAAEAGHPATPGPAPLPERAHPAPERSGQAPGQASGRSAHAGTGDLDRFGPGLQDDSGLFRAKIAAGVVSIVALAAMFVTSLSRAPASAASVVLAALAVGLTVAIGTRLVRELRARRRS